MRIGIVTHNYPPHPGGLEVLVQELARGLVRRGHEVTVVSTAWKGVEGVRIEDGVVVHRLDAWHGAEERGVPYALPLGPGVARGYSALRGCDVIHAHGSLYSTTLLGLFSRRSIPLVVTEHVGLVPYESRFLRLMQSLAWSSIGHPVLRRATSIVAYNDRVYEWLVGHHGEQRVSFIANGVDTDVFRPPTEQERRVARAKLGLPRDQILALFVGRAARKKNLETILPHARNGHYRLVVCGAERTLPPDVFNLGVVPHSSMPEVFATADFLLHPAVGEGFPVAIQEAMASGVPVALLWDRGYTRSLDRGAVASAESMTDLLKTARALALDGELRQMLGDRSRHLAVDRWDWTRAVAKHLAIFDAAMESSQ